MTRGGGGGRIQDIAKTALGGMLVIATRRDGPHYAQRTRTVWRGVFAFEALPPGEYVVSLPDYDTTATVTVVDQQTATVEVALPVLVRLRIKVTGRPHPSI